MKNKGTLKVELSGDRAVKMTRIFDAPRALVFDALTKPEMLKRWFGPHGWSLTTCESDFRVGGKWRFVLRGPDGHEMGMFGEYQEITPPSRTVHTESFDAFAGMGHSIVTVELVEHAGQTTFTATVTYPSTEVRDGVVASGMEHGAAESYDKLAEVLAGEAVKS